MTLEESLIYYRKQIDKFLDETTINKSIDSLYNPIRYILNSEGKRIRALLTMIVVKVFGSRPDTALFAGASIEVLHNFTLVHDDIMDNADTRRGLPTIHKKWDRETAILSGDTMMGMAYNILLQTKSNNLNQLCKIFSQGLLDVCEGQALDRDMEQSNTASIKEYLNMIKYKTARLIEVSAEMGALIATDNLLNIQSIKSFALNIGMAFQIQDDLLDVVGDETFGKKLVVI